MSYPICVGGSRHGQRLRLPEEKQHWELPPSEHESVETYRQVRFELRALVLASLDDQAAQQALDDLLNTQAAMPGLVDLLMACRRVLNVAYSASASQDQVRDALRQLDYYLKPFGRQLTEADRRQIEQGALL